jgi:hexosaminidase
MKCCKNWFAAGFVIWALVLTSVRAATPPIIPLPVQVQARPGTFTLCPQTPGTNAPAYAFTKILCDAGSVETGQYLAGILFKSTGWQFPLGTNVSGLPVRGAVLLTTSNANLALGSEGYELTVAPDSVVIRAPGQSGVFYGVQSLLQLLPPQIFAQHPVAGVLWTIPCIYIQDQPRFPWRGVMLDVSRHFFNKDEVKQVLDAMALQKLNTFHWHLTDDHGWRIQINSYPALTATASTNTGAWRTGIDYGQNPAAGAPYNSFGKYGGYYTQDEIREVVAYAQQRHITIVPEIELPAHCTAALVSYPSLGCGNSGSSYNMDSISYGVSLFSLAGPGSGTFFTNVLTEVMNLFPGQYIHCGGDEVVNTLDHQWTNYPPDKAQMQTLGINPLGGNASTIAYQHWFSTNIAVFLHANGRTMIGWSEFEAGGTVTNAALMDWETGGSSFASATASNGQYVIMSPNANCYINYYESPASAGATNLEPYFIVGGNPSYQTLTNVYGFEPIPSNLNSAYTNYILGAQCNLWTEYVPSARNAQLKMFPRVCALAELTWTPKTLKNFSDFTNRLATHEQRLDQMGINYNHGTIPQIGSWGPSVATTATTVSYDITPYVSKAGEINVSFDWTGPSSDGLNVFWVKLLENGTQVDMNTFNGFAGAAVYSQTGNALGGVAYYVLHLPWYHPGSTYTIQASISEHGANHSTTGNVYLPNWN